MVDCLVGFGKGWGRHLTISTSCSLEPCPPLNGSDCTDMLSVAVAWSDASGGLALDGLETMALRTSLKAFLEEKCHNVAVEKGKFSFSHCSLVQETLVIQQFLIHRKSVSLISCSSVNAAALLPFASSPSSEQPSTIISCTSPCVVSSVASCVAS